MKTASAPSLWGQPGQAPAPGAETHLGARRESGQTCLGMMQGRSQIPTSQIARGRPGPRDPLVGGCEPRTPPSTWERGQSREWGAGRGVRAPDGANRSGPPPLLRPARPRSRAAPSARPRAPRRPVQQVPTNADRCPAPPPCPSAAAVATESRAPGRVYKCRPRGRWRSAFEDSTALAYLPPAWQRTPPRCF